MTATESGPLGALRDAELYNAGWHECARMAKRDDLHCDIDSPYVEAKRAAAIEALATPGAGVDTPAPVAVESGAVQTVAADLALYADTDADASRLGRLCHYWHTLLTADAPTPQAAAQVTDDEREWLEYAVAHMLDDNEPEDATCAGVLQAMLDRFAALRPNASTEAAIQSCTCYDDTARRLCRRKGACLVATAQGEGKDQ